MNSKSDGCRLCLDPLAECFTTIDNPQLTVQMENVFCFPIKSIKGYCSGVCQSCSYAISEFYQYSEKVRQNQEVLNGNIKNCALANVKLETLSDSGLPETTEDACEQNNGVSEEEEGQNPSDDESYEPPPKTVKTKRRRLPKKIKLDDLKSDKPTTTSKQTSRKIGKQEINEEDQLFNKHFCMICDLCGTSTATFTELSIHFRKEHNRHDAYVLCCNKKLFKRNIIRDHMNFHANPDTFRCEMCGNKYKNKDILNRHMLCKHSSADPLECDICLQEYPHPQALYMHKLVTHAEPKYECEFCDKKFKKAISLKEHRARHTGEVLYACEYCGISKNRMVSLNRHIKLQHPTEWAQGKLNPTKNLS